MKQAREYCQCVAPNGQTGDYFLNTETGQLESPVFSSLDQLFVWARANGWVSISKKLGANMLWQQVNLTPTLQGKE